MTSPILSLSPSLGPFSYVCKVFEKDWSASERLTLLTSSSATHTHTRTTNKDKLTHTLSLFLPLAYCYKHKNTFFVSFRPILAEQASLTFHRFTGDWLFPRLFASHCSSLLSLFFFLPVQMLDSQAGEIHLLSILPRRHFETSWLVLSSIHNKRGKIVKHVCVCACLCFCALARACACTCVCFQPSRSFLSQDYLLNLEDVCNCLSACETVCEGVWVNACVWGRANEECVYASAVKK